MERTKKKFTPKFVHAISGLKPSAAPYRTTMMPYTPGVSIKDADNNTIAVFLWNNNNLSITDITGNKLPAVANAEYFTKAVNSHETAADVLDQVREYLEGLPAHACGAHHGSMKRAVAGALLMMGRA